VLIVIGVASGLLLGGYLTCLWGLRKSRGVRPDLLVVGLVLLPIAYFSGAEAFGWPTPGSIAVSTGAVTGFDDRWLLVGITAVTAVVTVAVLVKVGATRRLERWSVTPE
jgi:hypothetical protein